MKKLKQQTQTTLSAYSRRVRELTNLVRSLRSAVEVSSSRAASSEVRSTDATSEVGDWGVAFSLSPAHTRPLPHALSSQALSLRRRVVELQETLRQTQRTLGEARRDKEANAKAVLQQRYCMCKGCCYPAWYANLAPVFAAVTKYRRCVYSCSE